MMPPLWATLTVAMVIFLWLPRRWLANPRTALLALLSALAVACIPVGDLAVSAWIRGAIDDLSMVSMLLLALACFTRYSGRNVMSPAERRSLRRMILGAGLVLYPASLGLSMTDPWQWGFEPRWMIASTGLLALMFGVIGWWTSAMLICMATLAFLLGLKETLNYWDYLLDPLLVIAMTVQALSAAVASLRQRLART
jgi:hypothetical protein